MPNREKHYLSIHLLIFKVAEALAWALYSKETLSEDWKIVNLCFVKMDHFVKVSPMAT